ncbi:hypothetical protein FF1_022337 [Malus domestica]
MLSRLINGAVDGGFIEGIRLSKNSPCIFHLLFANDTLIFFQATRLNCQNITHLLKAYCTASKQEVSMQKSSVSFGANTSGELRNELVNILGMLQVQDPRKYLGIPTVWGGSKNEALAFVKDKVLAKIQGWKQGFLS